MLTGPPKTRFQEKPEEIQYSSPPCKAAQKLEKPRKINVYRSAIALKRTTTPTPSPAIDYQKTINWNMMVGEKLMLNAKEAAKDASTCAR